MPFVLYPFQVDFWQVYCCFPKVSHCFLLDCLWLFAGTAFQLKGNWRHLGLTKIALKLFFSLVSHTFSHELQFPCNYSSPEKVALCFTLKMRRLTNIPLSLGVSAKVFAPHTKIIQYVFKLLEQSRKKHVQLIREQWISLFNIYHFISHSDTYGSSWWRDWLRFFVRNGTNSNA